mmetsp:Transcript_25182/g.47345  ORF Transcript_25182/g.47345 Transcript_25182/m.47345 type:complete len:245 (-) Transcript_25182:3512-4246(-)
MRRVVLLVVLHLPLLADQRLQFHDVLRWHWWRINAPSSTPPCLAATNRSLEPQPNSLPVAVRVVAGGRLAVEVANVPELLLKLPDDTVCEGVKVNVAILVNVAGSGIHELGRRNEPVAVSVVQLHDGIGLIVLQMNAQGFQSILEVLAGHLAVVGGVEDDGCVDSVVGKVLWVHNLVLEHASRRRGLIVPDYVNNPRVVEEVTRIVAYLLLRPPVAISGLLRLLTGEPAHTSAGSLVGLGVTVV